MKTLQEKDDIIGKQRTLWAGNKLDKSLFSMKNDILRRVFIEDGIMYNPIALSEILVDVVLILAHDRQGHNGAARIYSSMKRLYYWKTTGKE